MVLKTSIADFYQSVKKGKKIIEGRLFYFNCYNKLTVHYLILSFLELLGHNIIMKKNFEWIACFIYYQFYQNIIKNTKN